MKFSSLFLTASTIIFLFSSCSKKEKLPNPAFVEISKWEAGSKIEELGHHLYFDKRLSDESTVSCNTCHDITYKRGGIDGFETSTGVNGVKGERNTIGLWNVKFFKNYNWTGSTKSLEKLTEDKLINSKMMAMESHEILIEKIEKIKGYQKLFKEAFPNDSSALNINNLSSSIAAFLNTLVAVNSDYDKFLAGDKRALTSLAQRGMKNFASIGCAECHAGKHLSGAEFSSDTKIFKKFPNYKDESLLSSFNFEDDFGRYSVTSKDSDKNLWRVPSLRNVAITSPYFHNGSVDNLEEAVKVMGKLQLDKDLSADDIKSLVAFMDTLTSKLPLVEQPDQI